MPSFCVAGLVVLALWTAPAVADPDALEFRHGVSQIPNYELKYPRGFTHFDYLNPEAPKGGTLVLPYVYTANTASPAYKPPGFFRPTIIYSSAPVTNLPATTVVSPSPWRSALTGEPLYSSCVPRPGGTTTHRLPQPMSAFR